MIAVTTNDVFLKVDEVEQALRELDGVGPWKIYPNFEAMLPDKDDIEIILNTAWLDARIAEFKKLRWVFSYSAGVECYPQEQLAKMGVILTNTSGVHAKSIAEQVLGAMIMFSRNLIAAFKNQTEKVYDGRIPTGELSGQYLLIVGAGAIGREIARKAKAFDMNVTGIRNHAGDRPEYFDNMYTMEPLDSLLPQAHYVVCVLPSTEATRHLFDATKLSLMHPDAVFMNVGRGDLVVEEDLVDVLRARSIRGAYLDVFEHEPVPQDSPLWELDNILMTPHNAGPTPHYFERAFAIFAENLRRLRRGEALLNRIDYALTY